jgi:hypothetical protein
MGPLHVAAVVTLCLAVDAPEGPSVAAPPAAAERIAVSTGFLRDFTGLLDAGLTRKAAGVPAAEARHVAARRSRPDDPRVDYAFALVLLRNFKQARAVEVLERSIETAPAYVPTHQALIRELLRNKSYTDVAEALLELADVVGPAGTTPAAEAEEAARWIGRVAAFLGGPLGDERFQPIAEKTADALRVRLGPDLAAAFDEGRVALGEEHRRLQDSRTLAAAEAEEEKHKELDQAAEKSKQLDAERERLEMSKDQWKAWIKEQVGEIDSQLGALEKQHGSVTSGQQSLTESITAVRLERERLLQFAADQNNNNRNSNLPPGLVVNPRFVEQQLAILEAQLSQYLAEYDGLERQRLSILSTAANLLGQRQSSLNRYQKATGEAAKEIQKLKRWDDRLQQQAEKAAKTPLSRSKQVAAVNSRIKSWLTFETFDFEQERQRLLNEYTTAP